VRALIILIAACVAGGAQPAFAQGDRAYVNVSGGMAIAPDATSGNILGEVGVRVAPNLFVFGNVGQIHNLQPSLVQPAIDAASATLSESGVTVTGTGRVPAWQTLGGVRYLFPMHTGLTPYVVGGAGVAHLAPTAEFTYTSGALPDGSTASPGEDVTSEIMLLGAYTQPAATNAFMFTLGGGVQVPVAPHVNVDVGYRLSRIDADTPVNAHSIIAGIGYRF
jgi:opacity protein-like surface antigen